MKKLLLVCFVLVSIQAQEKDLCGVYYKKAQHYLQVANDLDYANGQQAHAQMASASIDLYHACIERNKRMFALKPIQLDEK